MLGDIFRFPLCCVRAVGLFWADRTLLALCVVPVLLGVVSFVAALLLLLSLRLELAAWLFGDPSGLLVSLAAVLLAVLAASVLSLIVGFGLGGVFIELFTERMLHHVGMQVSSAHSVAVFAMRVLRGIVESLKRACAVGALVVLVSVTSFIPFLSIPLLLVTCFLIGSDVLDIPLTVLEYRFRARWRISWQHRGWCVVTGSSVMVAALIPFGALVIAPLVIGATVVRMSEWQQTTGANPTPSSS